MRVTTDRSEGGAAAGIEIPALQGEAPRETPAAKPWARGRTLITPRWEIPSWRGVISLPAQELINQFDRFFLWTPVAFGIGAAAYLGQAKEPTILSAALLSMLALALGLISFAMRHHRGVVSIAVLSAIMVCGFVAATIHSKIIAAPIMPQGIGVARLDGWVVDVETPSDTGERLLIAPVRISGLSPASTPTRVRIVVRSPGGPEGLPPPGTAIRVTALLDPPPGPASPGAYDFARDAWFEGIGGVGLALRFPSVTGLAPPPLPLKLEMAVNSIRWSTARTLVSNIRSVLGPDDGGAAGLAAAVTTSHQDWLAPSHRDDLRASGLAHMLAIAGLHTAAVSGFAFFGFRFLIASWPWLALRIPGKKVAAIAALMVVAGYLMLSGAHPPARRAAITASVAFFAILVDRRAVSLHSLALAALIILVGEPEVVLSPGFEMSFCATASLIALAEIWRRPSLAIGLSWPLAALQKLRDWAIALAAVSFVAGAATGPFAIQHFNRVANYGVFANLTADFLASAVLMPALAVSLAFQNIGVAPAAALPAYWLAGWSARMVVEIGHIFAVAPGAAFSISSAPQIALAISYLGIVLACLWRGKMRWIGLPMAAAVAIWPRPPSPVAWIASDGNDAAIVVGKHEIALKPGARLYATQLWAQRRGFTLDADVATATVFQQKSFDCDRKGCAPIGNTHPAIAAWWSKRPPSEGRLETLCSHADIVIVRANIAGLSSCGAAIVLTRSAFQHGGAAEVFRTSGGWRIAWTQPGRGDRPWTVNDIGG